MKIKVLQLVEGFNFGGAETKLLELVRHMDQARFETTVVSLGLGNEIEDLFNQLDCRVLTFRRQKQVDFALLKKVTQFIRDEKIDIVMSTLFYADVIAALAGHKGGAKGVFSWETISSPKWLVPHRFWAYRYAIRKADKVISVSQATADWLVNRRKVPPQKILIIPYGVNLEKFKPEPVSLNMQDLGFRQNDIIIGQVARLNEQKGHTYLINAAPIILEKHPQAKFVLVGDGPFRQRLEQQVLQKGLHNSFVFLGFRQDVHELLRIFDIFVLPSLYEGLPNVVLEAMATGLPVVATPVDGTKEAVIDRETGFLVPVGDVEKLADRIDQLVGNKKLKREMGNAGRLRVEKYFSLKSQISKFESLYEQYALR